jgi:hypothetical protein
VFAEIERLAASSPEAMALRNWEHCWQDGGEGWQHKWSDAFVMDTMRDRKPDALRRPMDRALKDADYRGKRR